MTSLADFVMPDLSFEVQALFRFAYGILLGSFLLSLLPHGKRFFLTERWGGYGKSSFAAHCLQNPYVYPWVMTAWFLAALCLAAGWHTVSASFINLLLCHYFFIQMRWKSLSRGVGAPGHLTYWLALAVFLLEYASHDAPHLRALVLLTLQLDFALILLSAGFYKLRAGYAENYGMEFGLVNPAWGHRWEFYKEFPPNHLFFKTLNTLAWASELAAAALILFPPTRLAGGLLVIVVFFFIATQIRLGTLCPMVMLCGLLFFGPHPLGTQFSPSTVVEWPLLNSLLEGGLWAYLFLLPLVRLGLAVNFYLKKSLPSPLQRALEAYTNFFGIIIWRVFTVDIVNFFIRIYEQAGEDIAKRLPISHDGWRCRPRFRHVAESITLACIFTTLKYYPHQPSLFRERLLRYAKTVPCPRGHKLVFEYLSIVKQVSQHEYVPTAEYHVDPCGGQILEVRFADKSFRPSPFESPIHETERPGTYAPLTA